MNVTHQFQQIGILLAKDGFVAVLKQMAMAVMPPIVGNGITGQQTPHHSGNRSVARFKQEMEMIGDQRPSQAARARFSDNGIQAVYEVVAVVIVLEYGLTLNAAANDMVQCAGGVQFVILLA